MVMMLRAGAMAFDDPRAAAYKIVAETFQGKDKKVYLIGMSLSDYSIDASPVLINCYHMALEEGQQYAIDALRKIPIIRDSPYQTQEEFKAFSPNP